MAGPEEAAAAGKRSWTDVVKTDVEPAPEENLDATYGFTRPEMVKKKPLVGSVDLYERHMFLRHNQPTSWPAKVEAPGYDPLPSKLVNAIRSKKNELLKKTRLTIADGQDEPEKTNGDILLFPDMVKYKGIAESDIESFVDEVLVKGQQWTLGEPETLVGSHVFICGHGSRDKRCGVCGPPLAERFNQEIAQRGLTEQVFVNFCSHIGGHKYAGNVIVFSRGGGTGDVSGHWYGYVTPEDVPEILEKHIGLGQVVDRLWRGQMGLTEDQQKEDQQKRNPADKPTGEADLKKDHENSEGLIANGGGDQVQQKLNPVDKPTGESDLKKDNGNVTTIANGGSDQRKVIPDVMKKHPPTLLPRIGSRDLHKMCGDENEEQGPLKPYAEKKKPKFKWPVWIEDWELGDTLGVVTLGIAVTAVYVTYRALRAAPDRS